MATRTPKHMRRELALLAYSAIAILRKNSYSLRDVSLRNRRKIIMLEYQGYTENGKAIPFGNPDLPDGCKVIITVLDKQSNLIPRPNVNLEALAKLRGCLHDFANLDIIPLEKNAWGKATIENAKKNKYDPQTDNS
jgi:hypothetical protein